MRSKSIEAIGRTAQEELRVVLGLLRDEEVETASLVPAHAVGRLEGTRRDVERFGGPGGAANLGYRPTALTGA